MVHLLSDAGYQIIRAETYDRCDYDLVDIWSMDYAGPFVKIPRKKTDVLNILKSAGASLENRGDNLYLLARKIGW
jgi:hypothetical protein